MGLGSTSRVALCESVTVVTSQERIVRFRQHAAQAPCCMGVGASLLDRLYVSSAESARRRHHSRSLAPELTAEVTRDRTRFGPWPVLCNTWHFIRQCRAGTGRRDAAGWRWNHTQFPRTGLDTQTGRGPVLDPLPRRGMQRAINQLSAFATRHECITDLFVSVMLRATESWPVPDDHSGAVRRSRRRSHRGSPSAGSCRSHHPASAKYPPQPQ